MVIGIPISLKMGCVLLLGWVRKSVRQREVFRHLSSDERFATQHLGLKLVGVIACQHLAHRKSVTQLALNENIATGLVINPHEW